jgi:putative ABC transport system permease protein
MGILVGLLMFFGIALYLQANPLTFYESMKISPEISFSILLESMLTMSVMAVVAGFIPAWLVTREDILKSIWGR